MSHLQVQDCRQSELTCLPDPLQERAGQKGFGLFANQDLKEGQFVIEYIGEVRLPRPSTRDSWDNLKALSMAWQLLQQLHCHCMGLQSFAGSSCFFSWSGMAPCCCRSARKEP